MSPKTTLANTLVSCTNERMFKLGILVFGESSKITKIGQNYIPAKKPSFKRYMYKVDSDFALQVMMTKFQPFFTYNFRCVSVN